MALSLCKRISSFQLIKNNALPLLNGPILNQVRYKHARQWPKKKKKNPFVSRHTDFIKHLCIALVKHERVFTSREKAKQLQQYGDLLINLTQRRRPPPDLFMIQNGFVLTEEEAIERRTRRRIVNRMSRKMFIPPEELSEEEYVEKCKTVINDILLGNKEAIEKLNGDLGSRFHGKYGGFVKITEIPLPKMRYPLLAYAEFVDNGLKPLPEMPSIVNGHLKPFPRSGLIMNDDDDGDEDDNDLVKISSQ